MLHVIKMYVTISARSCVNVDSYDAADNCAKGGVDAAAGIDNASVGIAVVVVTVMVHIC